MIVHLLLAVAAAAALWLILRGQDKGGGITPLALSGLVGLGVFLLVSGRLAGLVAVVAGLSPWIGRAMRLHGLFGAIRRLWARAPARTVQTPWLRVTIARDGSLADAVILAGPLAGRRLSVLSRPEALALREQVRLDADSLLLIEQWLDGAHPGWRPPAPPPAAAMTAAEALEILGLSPGAGPDDIRAAHRRLMQANHPDHGGSTWIAARLNQARDLLLRQP